MRRELRWLPVRAAWHEKVSPTERVARGEKSHRLGAAAGKRWHILEPFMLFSASALGVCDHQRTREALVISRRAFRITARAAQSV